MNLPRQGLEVLLDELWLDAGELCRLAGVGQPWLHERLAQGLFAARTMPAPEALRFDTADLRRARRLLALERDFDAAPELAALVADLEDEVAALRARLRRAGLV
ncbi:MAG: MerR family transcriptional regulator [Leptothrix sp. (in: Bacteria)]|nr:MerR family transcriptional regulator [Leptothrix sp. (in: b-proteobacteria)]